MEKTLGKLPKATGLLKGAGAMLDGERISPYQRCYVRSTVNLDICKDDPKYNLQTVKFKFIYSSLLHFMVLIIFPDQSYTIAELSSNNTETPYPNAEINTLPDGRINNYYTYHQRQLPGPPNQRRIHSHRPR